MIHLFFWSIIISYVIFKITAICVKESRKERFRNELAIIQKKTGKTGYVKEDRKWKKKYNQELRDWRLNRTK